MSVAPDAGDLVWVNFSPQAGHEQAGHRPALVLTPRTYHDGAVLADQAKSIDRAARRLRIAGKAPPAVLAEVQGKLAALLGVDRD